MREYTDWAGNQVDLVDKPTGKVLKVGDKVVDFRGDKGEIKGIQPPHKLGSSGRVYVQWAGGFSSEVYPSVVEAWFRIRTAFNSEQF